MYDFDLLPDDTFRTLIVALVLFAVAFIYFVIVSLYTLIKTSVYNRKHKEKLKLVCDVAYFHERGKRDNQEDSLYVSPMDNMEETGFVAACSDGMGGLLNGEVVSKYVTDSLSEKFPFKFDSQTENSRIITDISNKIYEEYHLSAGATLVMVHIFDDYMNFYSLGDSNIILIRNNKATLLNNKQNYVTMIIKRCIEGGIDTADAYKDNRAKGLIDFVGNLKCNVQMTKRPFRLAENDIILVSSDGVTDTIPLNRLVNHIHFDQNATGIARAIKYGIRTRKNPRQDNYSAVVIKMKRSYV
ncbi:MAG: SpoIIE family protein phosphatase [Saccharofermentans sp.]|nr:SpoIIE family protein phosphatase [Saccharofermentans sp.]